MKVKITFEGWPLYMEDASEMFPVSEETKKQVKLIIGNDLDIHITNIEFELVEDGE